MSELDGVTNLSHHSTAVAGMLAAAGLNLISNGVPLGPLAKGMAFEAQVQARDFNADRGKMIGAVGTTTPACRITLTVHTKGGFRIREGLGIGSAIHQLRGKTQNSATTQQTRQITTQSSRTPRPT